MKYIYLSVAFCISLSGLSQNKSFDQIVKKNAIIKCEDVLFNAYTIVKGLHERNQIDSLYQFIDYWEGECGVLELSFRLRTLLDIEHGRFSVDRISADWIEFLISYRAVATHGVPHPRSPEEVSINQQLEYLDTFLYNYARAIPIPTHSLDESLIVDFYSSKHPSFKKIASASPEESRLSEFHAHEQRRTERTEVADILFTAGYYHPIGKLSRFGGHPVFGMGYVYNIGRHSVIAELDLRAGPSRYEYTVVHYDSSITQRKWTSYYVGLEYFYEFLKKEKFSLAISPGIGYDWINAISSESEYGEKGKELHSLSTSIGLQARYRYNDEHSYGIQLRLHRADYRNPGGTRLNGGYLTLKVFWTFADGLRVSYRRKLLE